jgi:hypothetical protein
MVGGVEADIDRRLVLTRVPGSPNEFTAAEVRTLAVEYLRDRDEELRAHPWIAGQPHWNLWMADTELEDALFVVLVFRPTGVEFVCGTGNAFAIRRWDSDDPANPGGLEAELRRSFRVPESPVSISREAGEAWLGRGW